MPKVSDNVSSAAYGKGAPCGCTTARREQHRGKYPINTTALVFCASSWRRATQDRSTSEKKRSTSAFGPHAPLGYSEAEQRVCAIAQRRSCTAEQDTLGETGLSSASRNDTFQDTRKPQPHALTLAAAAASSSKQQQQAAAPSSSSKQ